MSDARHDEAEWRWWFNTAAIIAFWLAGRVRRFGNRMGHRSLRWKDRADRLVMLAERWRARA